MADTDIIVSEMTPASQINTGDLMIMTQPDAQAETGYTTKRGTVLQVANKMLKGTEYSTDLPDFTDKTPLGGLEELKADIKALLPIGSASGNPCNFDTDISDALVSLTADIVCGGGGGTPSAPIPLVGHSELNLTRCGKNFVPKGETSSSNGITFTVQDNGEVVVTGTATATAFWAVQFYIPSGSYILNGCPSGGTGCSIDVRNARGGSGISGISGDSGSGSSFTRTEELTAWLNIRVPNGYSAPSGGLKFSPMIRLASETSSEYEPYNGQLFTVAFGQTVYGGVYDKSGRLTITHRLVTEEDFNEYNAGPSGGGLAWVNVPTTFPMSVVSDTNTSSHLPFTTSGWGATSPCFVVASGGFPVRVYCNCSSLEDFKTQFSGLQIAYKLATPIEIDVPSISVFAEKGVNNIVSDCLGDVSVQYRDSIQHYIDSKIASVQALIL